jgi:hypothetical protein
MPDDFKGIETADCSLLPHSGLITLSTNEQPLRYIVSQLKDIGNKKLV